jgi:hypothetical protein
MLDRTVDLVSGDVDEPSQTMAERSVEQGLGADDVGHDEVRSAEYRPVDMRLGGEVDDCVDAGQHLVDEPDIEDVAFDEVEPRVVAHRVEVDDVASVGQLVEDDDGRTGKGGYSPASIVRTKWEPMNPAPPVTRIFMSCPDLSGMQRPRS